MALFPLGVTAEILINGTWTDITQYVYLRDPIAITGGATQEGDQSQPAQATLTLNNRDGRFSPAYTSGVYYPYLQRNVQLRVSVNDTSSSGNVYSGYRFWGEVHRWPPLSDLSGRDVYVQITANGPLRRVRAHGGKGSALTRYYNQLTGSYAPVAYWPCEEDPDTSIVGAGIDGGTNMTVTVGTPKWKAVSDFNGSAPVGVLNKSTWDGLTGSFGSSGDDSYTTPGTYQWVASTTTVDARVWAPGGGGENGNKGNAGGGGEFAREATLAVTPGTAYTVVVQPGGTGGQLRNSGANLDGADGATQTFTGDAVTVTAHGGKAGTSAGAGAGGTGSANTTHFTGGAGGTGVNGGGGGGGSGGTAANGNGGANASGSTGGAGGAAVTGGGKGGRGGDASFNANGTAGASPGGGGGGGADDLTSGAAHGGFPGGGGKTELIYTPPSVPPVNVIRFILFVPKHGGNNGRVLIRAKTGGTIAQLDVEYVSAGKLRLKGYSSAPALLFTSGNLTVGDGQTLMVSAELSPSGANVAWKLTAVKPGDTALLGTVSGTQATATLGNVSEILAGPNADITKTAIGHISLQYALIPLLKVSRALHGHHTEMGIDRFLRLAGEAALGSIPEFNETNDHWGFEASTQSWVGTNCALTNPATAFTPTVLDKTDFTVWPPDGTHSLLMTANGAGQPTATSPVGTSGKPVAVGDIVSVNAEFYAVATHSNVFTGILWYTGAGAACAHAGDDSADTVVAAGELATVKVTATAPATAAFFAVKVGNHNVDANTTLLYCDNVRVHPRMGPQTRKRLHQFLEEIEDLDAGILKEAKELWGLKYRTRIRMINQAPAVTLDYTAGVISPPLAPVVDDKNVKNHITVQRHKGSHVTVTHQSGAMSVQEPPAGAGRHKHHRRTAAEVDAQLAALASHLLTLGIVGDERYPAISVNLARAGIVNNAVAPLMSAIAGVEIGDYVQLTNLPFWYPSTTAKQIVIGYAENISAWQWDITWNCSPEAGWEIVTPRRW